MKREGDKRMYLIEMGTTGTAPKVTAVWGRRTATGIVMYTRFRCDDRLWAEPTSVFETELAAWEFIAERANDVLTDARAQIQRVGRFMPNVTRNIARLTKKKKGA